MVKEGDRRDDKAMGFHFHHENTQNLTVATVTQLCKHNNATLGVAHFLSQFNYL